MTIFKVSVRNLETGNVWRGFLLSEQNAMGTQGEAVSRACRTEESGMSVTVWNHAVMYCDVLQHGITARWAGKSIQAFELS